MSALSSELNDILEALKNDMQDHITYIQNYGLDIAVVKRGLWRLGEITQKPAIAIEGGEDIVIKHLGLHDQTRQINISIYGFTDNSGSTDEKNAVDIYKLLRAVQRFCYSDDHWTYYEDTIVEEAEIDEGFADNVSGFMLTITVKYDISI